MPREPEVIDICAKLEAETDKAWLLDDGSGAKQWVPRSQVENSDEVKRGQTGIFVMPVWLAKERGFV